MKTKTRLRLTCTIGITLMLFAQLPLRSAVAQATDPLDPDTFPPAYPEGNDYNILIGSAPNALFNGRTERCDTDEEAALTTLIANAQRTVANGETVCSAIPGIGGNICFGALELEVEDLANDTRDLAPCLFQDSIVDSAEIEATFENTKIIHGNLLTHDGNLEGHIFQFTAHDELLQAHDDQFMALDTFVRGSIMTILDSLTAINARVNANGDLLTSVLVQVISNGEQLSVLTELVQTPQGRREDFPIKTIVPKL